MQRGKREGSLYYHPTKTFETRKNRTYIFVPKKRNVKTSQIDYIEIMIDILIRMNKSCTNTQTKRKARSTEKVNEKIY